MARNGWYSIGWISLPFIFYNLCAISEQPVNAKIPQLEENLIGRLGDNIFLKIYKPPNVFINYTHKILHINVTWSNVVLQNFCRTSLFADLIFQLKHLVIQCHQIPNYPQLQLYTDIITVKNTHGQSCSWNADYHMKIFFLIF